MEYPSDTIWEFRMPRVKFGLGAVGEVGYEAETLGGDRVLIITDKGVSKAGLVKSVKEPLEERGLKVEVWDGVEPEP
ncbi:MAG: iron-containing alcohol dehydrogenase, partial [Candidatus Bathyarchaeia archaeon]